MFHCTTREFLISFYKKKQLNIDTDSHNCTCVCVCVQTHKSFARQFVNIHKKRNSKTNSNNNVYHDINMWGLYTIAPPFHVIHLLLLHSNRLTALILRRDSFVWKCASFKWFFFLSSLSWKRNKKYLLLFWWSSGGYKFTLFIWLYLCSNEKEHEFDYYAVAEFSMIVWRSIFIQTNTSHKKKKILFILRRRKCNKTLFQKRKINAFFFSLETSIHSE